MGNAGSLQPKGLERRPIEPRLRRVMGMIFSDGSGSEVEG